MLAAIVRIAVAWAGLLGNEVSLRGVIARLEAYPVRVGLGEMGAGFQEARRNVKRWAGSRGRFSRPIAEDRILGRLVGQPAALARSVRFRLTSATTRHRPGGRQRQQLGSQMRTTHPGTCNLCPPPTPTSLTVHPVYAKWAV